MTEQLFTTDEAAELLKVHPETVRNWIRRGELVAIKIGRQWRVKRADLERIAQRGTVEPGQVQGTQETPGGRGCVAAGPPQERVSFS